MTTESDQDTNAFAVLADPFSDPRVVALQGEITAMEASARNCVVASPGDAQTATDNLVVMTKVEKALTELRKDYVGPLNARVKEINALFKPYTDSVAQSIGVWKNAINHHNEQVRAVQEKAAEVARLSAEITRETGEILEPAPAVPATIERTYTELGSVSERANWRYEVVDFGALDDKYKLPDVATLTRLVKAGMRDCPGLRIWNEPIQAVHARKETEL
ncbi:MAG: hypothetical protein V3S51_07235 [Dehalococcoidia bacterium]